MYIFVSMYTCIYIYILLFIYIHIYRSIYMPILLIVNLSKRSKFFDKYERRPDLRYQLPRGLGREKRNIHTLKAHVEEE